MTNRRQFGLRQRENFALDLDALAKLVKRLTFSDLYLWHVLGRHKLEKMLSERRGKRENSS
jgi:hypothetical protein